MLYTCNGAEVQLAQGASNHGPDTVSRLTLFVYGRGAVAESVESGPVMWGDREFSSWSSQTNDL